MFRALLRLLKQHWSCLKVFPCPMAFACRPLAQVEFPPRTPLRTLPPLPIRLLRMNQREQTTRAENEARPYLLRVRAHPRDSGQQVRRSSHNVIDRNKEVIGVPTSESVFFGRTPNTSPYKGRLYSSRGGLPQPPGWKPHCALGKLSI